MKIVAVLQNQQTVDELRHNLATGEHPLDVVFVTGNVAQAGTVIQQNQPGLLICDATDLADLRQIGHVSLHHPGIEILVLTRSQSPEFLTEAMRSGVREVLSLPVSAPALLEAIQRVERRKVLISSPRHRGKILAFIACKGGSGATFLASNFAYVLAESFGKKVALFDLNLHFGNASLYVTDRAPPSTLADEAANIQRLDASFLASSMIQVLPNFSILAAPESPERAAEVKPAHIDALLELAISQYDFIVLDISRTLDAVSVRALDRAELIFPVLQETLPFIRDAKRMLATFQSLGYGRDKVQLIINRYEKGGDIRLEDVEYATGMKVTHTIPNSFKAVSASVNQGTPVLKIAPHDPVTKALRQLGQTLTAETATKQGGWFGQLFGR